MGLLHCKKNVLRCIDPWKKMAQSYLSKRPNTLPKTDKSYKTSWFVVLARIQLFRSFQEVVLNLCNQLNFYWFKVNNRNTTKRCEIGSKLTIKTPERRQ